ncbi:MAG: carbohydrate kinase [Acholeplasmataceae bacterium]|nr:carbohydrate kinase [Acholeplasmataceae bacterium]
MKTKLIAIGELLIDFIPYEKERKLKDVNSFFRVAGGAPANVCACVSKLGEQSVMLTKVGIDAFGDFLIDTLKEVDVDVSHIKRTDIANTALAFVSIDHEGERDFSFYRNPSADLLLDESEIDELLFQPNDVLHFCSVDLVDAPVRKAHEQAIKYAQEHQMIISFDPNLRFPLWKDKVKYRQTILEFIPKAHLLKISDDELFFITGKEDINESVQYLFQGDVKVVIVTKGSLGATVYTKTSEIFVPSYQVEAVDTTGAGDAFIGAVIYQILNKKIDKEHLEDQINEDIIRFAHHVSAYVVSRYGAIPSMPKLSDLEDKNNKE